MYERYWGLSGSPFQNTLDDSRIYESPQHEEALARLYYLVEQRRHCGLLIGVGGTGKSLLLSILANQVRRTQRQSVEIDLLGMTGGELLWQVAAQLNLSPRESDPPSSLWRAVRDQLHALAGPARGGGGAAGTGRFARRADAVGTTGDRRVRPRRAPPGRLCPRRL